MKKCLSILFLLVAIQVNAAIPTDAMTSTPEKPSIDGWWTLSMDRAVVNYSGSVRLIDDIALGDLQPTALMDFYIELTIREKSTKADVTITSAESDTLGLSRIYKDLPVIFTELTSNSGEKVPVHAIIEQEIEPDLYKALKLTEDFKLLTTFITIVSSAKDLKSPGIGIYEFKLCSDKKIECRDLSFRSKEKKELSVRGYRYLATHDGAPDGAKVTVVKGLIGKKLKLLEKYDVEITLDKGLVSLKGKDLEGVSVSTRESSQGYCFHLSKTIEVDEKELRTVCIDNVTKLLSDRASTGYLGSRRGDRVLTGKVELL